IKASTENDDGGTCNLDGTFLPLEKGQRAGKILAAIKNAGLSAQTTKWIGRGIMIAPPGDGQANKRYASNEALIGSLRRSGWPVLTYYQMD
ncbi:MAG TPA: hypothetical protein VFS68_00665, partial [Candidatus Udaeobacter sp.]|nr:hypothetical protein [Candidatus Udaeobacter sp.]